MPEITDTELAEFKRLSKLGTAYEALKPQFDQLTEQVKAIPALQQEVAGFKAAKLDGAFKSAGIEDAKVRKLVQMEFDEQATAEGGHKELEGYLAHLQGLEPDKRPAILAPFIKAAPAGDAGAGAGAGAGNPAKPGLPNVDKGAKGVEGAPAGITAEQVAKMSPADFVKNYQAIQAQVPALANVSLPGAAPKSA